MAGLTISRFAAGGGVGVETIRFYQRRGLLAVPERRGAGYREYSEDDQRRLAFICRAKDLGFTLSEIADLLGPAEAGPAGTEHTETGHAEAGHTETRHAETGHTTDILQAARAKLDQTQRQLADLTLLRCRLLRLVSVCEDGDGEDCLALRLGQPRDCEMSKQ
jgi:DNA-binding transcriptional MerR regulator